MADIWSQAITRFDIDPDPWLPTDHNALNEI